MALSVIPARGAECSNRRDGHKIGEGREAFTKHGHPCYRNMTCTICRLFGVPLKRFWIVSSMINKLHWKSQFSTVPQCSRTYHRQRQRSDKWEGSHAVILNTQGGTSEEGCFLIGFSKSAGKRLLAVSGRKQAAGPTQCKVYRPLCPGRFNYVLQF